MWEWALPFGRILRRNLILTDVSHSCSYFFFICPICIVVLHFDARFFNVWLARLLPLWYTTYCCFPGVAQLVARLTGGQEAVSSSLATRTK